MSTTCTKCYLQPAEHMAEDHPWRMEVDTGERNWATNALTFASEADALASGLDLMGRWMMVRDYRAVLNTTPTGEPVIR